MNEAALTQQFFRNILRSETSTRQKIIDHQRRLLERLIRHARQHVPFYRDSGRLDLLFRPDGAIDWSRWGDLPILTRREAKDNEKALGADWLPPEMLPLDEDMTSGSTGVPFRFQRTKLSRIASSALLGRAIDWHDKGAIGAVAAVRSVPADLGNQVTTGAITIPLHLPARDQLALLERVAPTHLVTYPNQLLAWLDFDTGQAFRNLRVAVLTGEVIHSETRTRLARQLGITLIEAYATSEVGAIAFEGKEGSLLVCEENILFECLEETAERPGHVVLTPFYNHATPLIRYAPGDFAVMDPLLADKALRGIKRVVGRERNLFRAPNGDLFYPSVAAKLFVAILDHREWQLVQTTRHDAVFRVVCPTPPSSAQLKALRDALGELLHGLKLTIAVVPEIEPGTAGKPAESIIRSPGIN
ncbi:phenylacetate--CoA ligase family protein [Taklimakanibacter lacteus]|uniref:phenylacetate--CoA ligase family protein n=1 Tax=Taklimakanibacter lacteus TaxID=2268456 RepID=UPI000E66CF74